jgi:FkbM family methyltransferase
MQMTRARTPVRQSLYDGSKAIAQRAAALAGFELQRAGHEADRHAQRAILLERLGVSVVLDVGANIGQYAAEHLRRYSRYRGRVISFEPVAECYEQCAARAQDDSLWTAFHYGLSDVAGVVPIHVPRGQTDLSSLRTATAAGSRMMAGHSIDVEHVEVRRLDDVIDDLAGGADVLALKLDVQGHELAVLSGAQQTLKRVALLECELPLVPLYEGQDSFVEMLARVQAMDFVPVGIMPNYLDRASGYVMDADVLFVSAGTDRG